jgi:hypothetical protein
MHSRPGEGYAALPGDLCVEGRGKTLSLGQTILPIESSVHLLTLIKYTPPIHPTAVDEDDIEFLVRKHAELVKDSASGKLDESTFCSILAPTLPDALLPRVWIERGFVIEPLLCLNQCFCWGFSWPSRFDTAASNAAGDGRGGGGGAVL